jgi:glycogen phosphorylase
VRGPGAGVVSPPPPPPLTSILPPSPPLSRSIRDRLIESWNDTNAYFEQLHVKRVSYLSLEFLMGRTMQNALLNMDLEPNYRKALEELGFRLEDLFEHEKDAALGNGGLGRLAACFLDSMATLDLPAWGYGIRYNYGIFKQVIVDGAQVEVPDYWLTFGNPWEIERQDIVVPVRFYGTTRVVKGEDGSERTVWEGGETVVAVAYDNPIPGFDTWNTINLRLWKALPSREFDFASFNSGDYLRAVEARQRAENISSVLYPADNTYQGKELRLKQQYFFVCATISDIVRRFKRVPGWTWSIFPEKNAMQLNDTHPTIAIPELMRVLVDDNLVPWSEAWAITQRVFGYTNHTILPEVRARQGAGEGRLGAVVPCAWVHLFPPLTLSFPPSPSPTHPPSPPPIRPSRSGAWT